MTFQEAYTKAQSISGDSSAATLLLLKADINLGSKKLNAAMNRYWTRKSKSADVVASQQYYQLPPDALRVSGVKFALSDGRKIPIRQIRDEYRWNQLNIYPRTSNWFSYWFQKGADEIGVYPLPANDTTDGLIIYYEPKDSKLTQDDYTTGTVALVNGTNTVTGTGVAFTDAMIGRSFTVTDGSDGYTYTIAGRTSGTIIYLEEPYVGLSGSGITFKIGETFLFPEEYHDAPIDYALSQFFELRNNPERAAYHLKKFEKAKDDAREQYASSSSSSVITDEAENVNPWFLPPNTITE